MTSTDVTPKPKTVIRPPVTANITWLLQSVDGNVSSFSIDRKDKQCHTPRRNAAISSATLHFTGFNGWAQSVISYFRDSVFCVPSGHGLDISKVNANSVFVPVVPLFEETENKPKKLKAQGEG